MWNTTVFIKYSEAKHLRYWINTKSFSLSDLPHKLIPTPMVFSYVHQKVNEPTRCLCTIETEVRIIIRNNSVKLELLHIATRHVDMFKHNVLKIHVIKFL